MNDIEREIMAACRSCVDENEQALLERAQSAGRKSVRMLKTESRSRTGAYRKGWHADVSSGETGVDVTVHNKVYQLTHLLENDHRVSNQTHRVYGTARGDGIIARVAETVGREFMAGGDGR